MDTRSFSKLIALGDFGKKCFSIIRYYCLFILQGKIIVGTKESEFIEITEKTGEMKTLTCGHGEGELWGLATHPSALKFLSASEDGTLRQWDLLGKVGITNDTLKICMLMEIILLNPNFNIRRLLYRYV